MNHKSYAVPVKPLMVMCLSGALLLPAAAACATDNTNGSTKAAATLDEGRKTFRFDTFGDEAFWGDTLRLHEAIAGASLGGTGPGLSPRSALARCDHGNSRG